MARLQPALSGPPGLRDHGFHRLRVGRIVTETADACTIVLEVPDELRPTFRYEPGQFCNLRVELGGAHQVRCYSMSSSPAVDDELAITVKRVPGGLVSNWLNDHLAPGDPIDVSPPGGFFRLTPTDDDLVAFAAGSGITPIQSLLKTALATTSRSARLLYANRDRTDIIFDDELAAMEERHRDRFRVVHHLDEAQGLVTADDVRAFAGAPGVAQYYVCGPAPFMEVVEDALLDHGCDPCRFHIERFTPVEFPARPSAAEETATGARVTIELDGRTDSVDHHPGTTILQTARQMGMSPPFSCESGSCATCMARLIEGEVSMYVNNALTPDEVDDGLVLTCQSVPTTPTVHVVYDFEEG